MHLRGGSDDCGKYPQHLSTESQVGGQESQYPDYANQYVAVLNRSVIAAAETIENLHKACSRLTPPPTRDELTVAFISKEPRGMLL